MKDDQTIINELFERKEESLIAVKEKYGKLICFIAANILKLLSDVEECENDTYLTVWNTVPPTRPVKLKAYCGKISRNLALKKYEYEHAEKRNADVRVAFDELEELLCDKEEKMPQRVVERQELADAINSFLGTLGGDERRIFILKYWYFASISEIMERSGMSKSKVQSMLFRTRKKLKTHLQERGFLME